MNLSFGPKPELAENELAKLITAVDQSTECRLSAFAMVTHDRLGQDSLFFALEPEIVVMILSSIWEAEYRELLHAEQQASNMRKHRFWPQMQKGMELGSLVKVLAAMKKTNEGP